MKLKDHLGFRRLAVLLSIVSFFVAYILLLRNEKHQDWIHGFNTDIYDVCIKIPIIAIIISVAIFVFVRIVYWVIDGFRKQE